MRKILNGRRLLFSWSFLVVGLVAVFFVPYLVPVAPVVSDAYAFGFNNRVALVLFLFVTAGFAIGSEGAGLKVRSSLPGAERQNCSRQFLWITCSITATVTGGAWLLYRGIGGINEGTYLVDRLQHLAAGEHIYRDFEFLYGPTMLYLPLAVHRGLHLSLLDAYYSVWALSWVGGVALLWFTVQWVCASSPHKRGIYLLAYLGFIFSVASLGLNYTPLRFVAGPFFAAFTVEKLKRHPSVWPAVLTAVAGGSWTLFYSPEQGIAYLLATMVYFAVFVERRRAGYVGGLMLLAAAESALLLMLLRTGVWHYVRAMASGGYNLPLLPSLPTLVLLGLLVAAVCVLWNSLRLRLAGTAVEYVILLSVFALPAAFGRCDPGHLYMNTLGAYLAAWTVLSYRRGASRWMVWSYVPSAIFLPLALYQANNFFMYPIKGILLSPQDTHPAVRSWTTRLMTDAIGPQHAQAMLAKWRSAYPVMAEQPFEGGRVFLAPLGYPTTLLSAYSAQVTNGRYRGEGNVMTAGEEEEKVSELRNHPDRLLVFTEAAVCPNLPPVEAPPPVTPAMDHAARRDLLMNLQPLYLPHLRHSQALLAPLCVYIKEHYRPTSVTGPLAGSTVWERVPNRD